MIKDLIPIILKELDLEEKEVFEILMLDGQWRKYFITRQSDGLLCLKNIDSNYWHSLLVSLFSGLVEYRKITE
jgi:hypothetical protein